MKTAKLSIDISEDVYSTLEIEGYTKAKLEKNARQALAISLFLKACSHLARQRNLQA